MVETDQIRIDEIQRKLRHRYMLLVGLNIIAYQEQWAAQMDFSLVLALDLSLHFLFLVRCS